MRIVITGASRGIGLATAKQLDKPGNQLFLVASSKDSFKHQFKNAVVFGADLADIDVVESVAEDILSQAATIDVLINNAGVQINKKFKQLTILDINKLLDLNLRSHVLLTHYLLPGLEKSSNPQILFMSSMAAKVSIEGESVYAATKSAISNFANVLRNELGPKIRVSTVHAWGVDTWGAPVSKGFIQPSDVAETMDFIISRSPTVMIESIDLSNPTQWRGGHAPWSPN